MLKKELTQELARENFSYNELTGELAWIKSDSPRLKNSLPSVVKTSKLRYASIKFLGNNIAAHKLIWLHKTGELPDPTLWRLDHKDLDISNNAWLNLRKIPLGANIRNQRQEGKNTASGITGVYFVEKKANQLKPWAASIRVDKKLIHLGFYESAEKAKEARQAAHNAEMLKIEQVYENGSESAEGYVHTARPTGRPKSVPLKGIVIVGEFKEKL